MDRRRHPRVAAELAVQVWGIDSFSQPFAQPGRVKNISSSGMVVSGLTSTVRVGSVLEIQHEQEKASFRVVWVGQYGTRRQGEIGLAKLASEPQLLQFQSATLHACAGNG
jgi:hypothetical protein